MDLGGWESPEGFFRRSGTGNSKNLTRFRCQGLTLRDPDAFAISKKLDNRGRIEKETLASEKWTQGVGL